MGGQTGLDGRGVRCGLNRALLGLRLGPERDHKVCLQPGQAQPQVPGKDLGHTASPWCCQTPCLLLSALLTPSSRPSNQRAFPPTELQPGVGKALQKCPHMLFGCCGMRVLFN